MAAILDLGWSIFEKIVITSCKKSFDIILVQIHSEVLDNCQFHVFAMFSNGSQGPSRIAQS